MNFSKSYRTFVPNYYCASLFLFGTIKINLSAVYGWQCVATLSSCEYESFTMSIATMPFLPDTANYTIHVSAFHHKKPMVCLLNKTAPIFIKYAIYFLSSYFAFPCLRCFDRFKNQMLCWSLILVLGELEPPSSGRNVLNRHMAF